MSEKRKSCPFAGRCGGCGIKGQRYEKTLEQKQKKAEELLSPFCAVSPIIGMASPYYYRNKVHHAYTRDRSGNIISGPYEKGSHWILNVKDCLIEDRRAQEILSTVGTLLKTFRIRTYDEDAGTGFFRRALIRRGFQSNEVMVVLVAASFVFPGKNNFVKALTAAHPDITTIILNVNRRTDSMILGDREEVLYGPGFIRDTLCGLTFRISSGSFYQVNPVQTEILYGKALKFADLTGKERVIDAYCGIGTIGLTAAHLASEVISVELNPEAVKDAVKNAKENHIENVRFHTADATEFLKGLASQGGSADVIFLDPPRAGSTPAFIRAAASMQPSRIVYISCSLVTLARDLALFQKRDYEAVKIQPVDMFPWSDGHVETVCLMSRVEGK